ncbi:MAG: ABC transporter substrate-binding protein [Candidatus Heteroscillospira sp.]|jgi:iron complex transport system substrate-binding protein
MKLKRFVALLLAGVMLLAVLSGCAGSSAGESSAPESTPAPSAEPEKPEARTVTDMRGVTVTLPDKIERVAILDKGFLVQTMTALGVADKIVASGDLIQGAEDAKTRDSLYLCPQLLELPQIGYPTAAVDYETLVGADPDIVILRNSEYIKDSEITAEAINKIENELHIPLVVVNGPGCYDEVSLETQYEGVRLMGELFEKTERAEEVVKLMDETISLISERTEAIPEEEKPSVMYIGGLKGGELTGSVWGDNYGDAKFSADIAHIKNVHPKHEAIRQVSAEQIIALNPDKIILCTVSPTPQVFLTDELYAPLESVTAVRNGDVASVGLLTWWGDFRLEAPTILLIAAKSVYPEQFEDINVGQWLNDYHMALYGLSEEEAQELKAVQQLDWMDDEEF